jgi:NACalpha-BTF3-like transcription factor
LLQGIAYLYDSRQNNNNPSSLIQSQERLEYAFVLLQCLRRLAPPDSVQQLLDISPPGSNITASDAIAALRKNQGNVDAAAMALTETEDKRVQCHKDRELQHRHGVCQNEIDPIDLATLDKLRPLLVTNKNGNDEDDDECSELLAVGLLRLSNNDLTSALDLYAACDHSPYSVFAKVEALDCHLFQKGLLNQAMWTNKKRKLRRRKEEMPVDDIAFVTLLSMGVEDAKARLALQNNDNNVDQALLWLTATRETWESKPTHHENSSNDGQQQQEPDADMAETPPLDESSGDEGSVNGPGGETPPSPDLIINTQQDALEQAAQELLRRELGDVLEERNLEKEYLGKSLDEEWHLVLKYRGQRK